MNQDYRLCNELLNYLGNGLLMPIPSLRYRRNEHHPVGFPFQLLQ